MCGYSSAPNSCRPSGWAQSTCTALGRLKGLQTDSPAHVFFSFPATALISLEAPFLLGVFFSKLKVSLFLLPQSRSTSITFFLKKPPKTACLGYCLFCSQLNKTRCSCPDVVSTPSGRALAMLSAQANRNPSWLDGDSQGRALRVTSGPFQSQGPHAVPGRRPWHPILPPSDQLCRASVLLLPSGCHSFPLHITFKGSIHLVVSCSSFSVAGCRG